MKIVKAVVRHYCTNSAQIKNAMKYHSPKSNETTDSYAAKAEAVDRATVA